MYYSLSGISAPSLDDADSPEVEEFVMPLDKKHQGGFTLTDLVVAGTA